VLLTPITADAIAELLVDGKLPEEVRGFEPDRFAARVPVRPKPAAPAHAAAKSVAAQ